MTNQSELEQMLIKLCWVTAPSNQDDVDKVLAYITANYTPNSEVTDQVREARIEELTRLLSMQNNKPRRVLLKDAVNIAYSRVCELSDVKKLPRFVE